MKRTLIILLLAFISSMSCFAGDDIVINKENCTITKDGKTFNLYGKVEIVKDYGDIKVEFVKYYGDIKVKIVNDYPSSCGEVKIVKDYGDIKIEIVNDYPGMN